MSARSDKWCEHGTLDWIVDIVLDAIVDDMYALGVDDAYDPSPDEVRDVYDPAGFEPLAEQQGDPTSVTASPCPAEAEEMPPERARVTPRGD